MRLLSLFTVAPLAGFSLAGDKVGSIKLVIDGVTYDVNNEPKVTNPASIQVVGQHVTMDIDPKTFAVTNYTLTGFANDLRLVSRPTVVFASKTVALTAAQLTGISIDQISISPDTTDIRFLFNGGKLKYQIKDLPQGGMMQVETETGAPIEFTHTLGEELFYFLNPFTNKTNGGNGLAAVSKTEDPVNYHHMLLVKESPQVATNTFQGSKVSKWLVQSGGRMGGVLGEDAVEFGTGATNCTSQCQAQNQIHGSLPVPPDPTSVTPLPDPTTV